jgi:excisionase family DNA binding protein
MAATLSDLQDLHRETLTLKDIARYFNVSHETARKIVRMDGFPLFQHERTFRVPKQAFLEWIERQTGAQSRA